MSLCPAFIGVLLDDSFSLDKLVKQVLILHEFGQGSNDAVTTERHITFVAMGSFR